MKLPMREAYNQKIEKDECTVPKSPGPNQKTHFNHPSKAFAWTDIHLRVGRHEESFERTRLREEGEMRVSSEIQRPAHGAQIVAFHRKKPLSLM